MADDLYVIEVLIAELDVVGGDVVRWTWLDGVWLT